jgi:hypothetical protein
MYGVIVISEVICCAEIVFLKATTAIQIPTTGIAFLVTMGVIALIFTFFGFVGLRFRFKKAKEDRAARLRLAASQNLTTFSAATPAGKV